MQDVSIRKEDQILMSLVHYFVTKENYSPIFVQGVKDEIWLEKLDGPYRIIRINSNRIFNEEQFNYDQIKIKSILRQVKKKTMTFSINALNINLNEEPDIEKKELKHVDSIKIDDINNISENKELLDIFPNLKDGFELTDNGLELILNVTKDINDKTEKDNKRFNKIFSKKKIYVTYILIALCTVAFFMQLVIVNFTSLGYNLASLVKSGQIYRLLSSAFLHGSIIHLFCNMYSLKIIGSEIEAKFGKLRFIFIYLISAIAGNLLSCVLVNNPSVGASGAIFGLMGALLYFGYNFRLYLKESIVKQIIPIILLNLFIGYTLSSVNNVAHIGGLIAGYFAAMAVGLPGDNDKKERINGIILLLIYIIFITYLVFFR